MWMVFDFWIWIYETIGSSQFRVGEALLTSNHLRIQLISIGASSLWFVPALQQIKKKAFGPMFTQLNAQYAYIYIYISCKPQQLATAMRCARIATLHYVIIKPFANYSLAPSFEQQAKMPVDTVITCIIFKSWANKCSGNSQNEKRNKKECHSDWQRAKWQIFIIKYYM